MQIRRATLQDARNIRRISNELTVSRYSTRPGFVEYPTPSITEYQSRIRDNPFFHVAEQNGVVIGFSAAYTSEKLHQIDTDQDEFMQYFAKKSFPFIYWDQLGIVRAFQRRGHGTQLASQMIQDIIKTRHRVILAAPVLKPKRNNGSIKLLENLGFNSEKEFLTENCLTFGIYKKDLIP